MTFDQVLSRFPDAKKNRAGYIACCPVHEDRTPSLALQLGNNGNTLLHCFAGCSFEDVCAAIGIKPADMFAENLVTGTKPFPKRTLPTPQQQTLEPTEIYRASYNECAAARRMAETLARDWSLCERIAKGRNWKPETVRGLALEGYVGWDDGNLAFIYDTGIKLRCRKQGERVIWWAFGKAWIWRGAWLKLAKRVYVTEGETDCISLVDAGIENRETVVVALPSASTFNDTWGGHFKGKDVILAFDNDETGAAATDKMAKALGPVARSLQRLNWEALATNG